MRKSTVILCSGITALFLTFGVLQASAQSSYAEDRAMIEDLQARYVFALDFRDADVYASTFAEDGVLISGAGELRGREAIRDYMTKGRERAEAAAKDSSGQRPATGRHNITNIVIKIDGNKAIGRAYWFQMGNNNPKRSANLNAFGHYEDEMVKVDGKWFFSKRKIYNEQSEKRTAGEKNPAW
jgi:hypothetical protein